MDRQNPTVKLLFAVDVIKDLAFEIYNCHLIQEVSMHPHIHKYKFECESSNNHNHRMLGHTENMIGFSVLHFHYFFGICSYNNHTHYYAGITSLPVRTENGHIHRIEGILEINNSHEHKFGSYTFEDVEYISGRKKNEAYAN